MELDKRRQRLHLFNAPLSNVLSILIKNPHRNPYCKHFQAQKKIRNNQTTLNDSDYLKMWLWIMKFTLSKLKAKNIVTKKKKKNLLLFQNRALKFTF